VHIWYVLFKTHFNNGAGQYAAKARPLKIADTTMIIERMRQRGSKLVPEELGGTIELLSSTIELMLAEGYAVSTPLVTFGVSIKGPFETHQSPFDPSIHQLGPNLKPTTRLRRLFKQPATVERVTPNKIEPDPVDLFDKTSGETDGVITPGKTAILSGENLKFDEADETQGIFLIDSAGNQTRVTTIIRNKPSELIFEVPEGLAGGEYTLVVRAKMRGGRELREGKLAATLTVS